MLSLGIFLLAAAIPPAPVARQAPVTDTYFGTPIVDPYRWMENSSRPEFQAYLKAQDRHTRAMLDRIPGRAALITRLEELADTINVSRDVRRRGSTLFYEKLAPGSKIERLYVRDGQGERVLFDPEKFFVGTHHVAISYFLPSFDGKLVAIGLSAGGSENAVLHFLDSSTGRELPDAIDRARFGVTSWRLDGAGVYYLRLQRLMPGMPAEERDRNVRTYFHRLGTNPDQDVAVLGAGVSADVPCTPDEFAPVFMTPGSNYALAIVVYGVRNEIRVYLARAQDLLRGAAHWRPVAGYDDDVTSADIHASDLMLLSHKDALRFKVLKVDAAAPDLARATVVVAPSARVIESINTAQDALYVASLEDGRGRIARIDWSGHASEVRLPIDGSVSSVEAEDDHDGFLAQLEGWTESPLWYQYDPSSGELTDTRLDPVSPVDYSNVVADEVKVPARDGTLIPVSIIHRRDLKRDGSNPTIAYAYGSYGINSNPTFSPIRMAWYERGGIYAIVHVRGGGEYGEEWHLAGKDANKINTVTDFVDCCRWLVSSGWTSPAKLGARGGSAGGITMGLAISLAPRLFAGVLDEIPVSDQLRIETTANGPPNVPEFGTVTTREGFANLYRTSPVQHVKKGVAYPAVMLMTGANDPRVDPWQAAKMTATLQAATTSGKPILLRVDYEGGHGLIGATKQQAAITAADEYAFLFWSEGVPGFQPL